MTCYTGCVTEVHSYPSFFSLFRRSYREARGSVDIPLPEAEVHVACSDLDSLQPRVSIERLDPGASASRQLVAEMMILAGEAVGLLGGCGSVDLYLDLDPGDSASRQLVAEMMILAGEVVGLLGGCGPRSGSRGQCKPTACRRDDDSGRGGGWPPGGVRI